MTIEGTQIRSNPGEPRQARQQSAWAGHVGYTDGSLAADLARLRDTWRYVQSSRDRDAIFRFLTDVFELVAWWTFDKKVSERARCALAMKGLRTKKKIEVYTAVIVASVAPKKIDKRTVSKWSRALRFAAASKPRKKRLRAFMKAQGGINACATAYSRQFSR